MSSHSYGIDGRLSLIRMVVVVECLLLVWYWWSNVSPSFDTDGRISLFYVTRVVEYLSFV